jgi:hypothetical protein
MMILYAAAGEPAQLLHPDDLKSFKAVLSPSLRLPNTHVAALEGVAEFISDNAVWVSQAWVLQACGMEGSAVWRAGFAKMLDYAAKQGWIRDSDGAIRAHVEWSAI